MPPEPAPAPPAVALTPAWTAEQQAELVELVANKSARETEKLLAELEPELRLPRERERALGGGRYEVRVILDQTSVEAISNLKSWLSHVNPGFTTGQLLAYLLQQAQRVLPPSHAAVHAPPVRRRTGERRQQTTTAPAASPSTERLVRRRTGACRGRRASLSAPGRSPISQTWQRRRGSPAASAASGGTFRPPCGARCGGGTGPLAATGIRIPA